MALAGGPTQRQVMLTLDVLPNILDHVSSPDDLFCLCLTSRSVAYYARNRLYDGTLFVRPSIGLDSDDHRQVGLVLIHRPPLEYLNNSRDSSNYT